MIALVESARSRGVEIVSDQYPYDGAATSSLIGIIVIPSSMTDLGGLRTFGPVDSEAARRFRSMLVDPSRRTQLKEASENGIDGGFAWLKATGYTSMRIVSSTDYPELVGVYLSELPEEGQDPFDAVMDLIAGASASVNITLGAITEEDVRTLMIQPWNMIASDGAYADGSEAGRGHPRGAGTFARFLGHYVREEEFYRWKKQSGRSLPCLRIFLALWTEGGSKKDTLRICRSLTLRRSLIALTGIILSVLLKESCTC